MDNKESLHYLKALFQLCLLILAGLIGIALIAGSLYVLIREIVNYKSFGWLLVAAFSTAGCFVLGRIALLGFETIKDAGGVKGYIEKRKTKFLFDTLFFVTSEEAVTLTYEKTESIKIKQGTAQSEVVCELSKKAEEIFKGTKGLTKIEILRIFNYYLYNNHEMYPSPAKSIEYVFCHCFDKKKKVIPDDIEFKLHSLLTDDDKVDVFWLSWNNGNNPVDYIVSKCSGGGYFFRYISEPFVAQFLEALQFSGSKPKRGKTKFEKSFLYTRLLLQEYKDLEELKKETDENFESTSKRLNYLNQHPRSRFSCPCYRKDKQCYILHESGEKTICTDKCSWNPYNYKNCTTYFLHISRILGKRDHVEKYYKNAK
jgi:hypothetical protein